MENNLISAKRTIYRFLILSVLASAALLVYLVYYRLVINSNHFDLEVFKKLWYLKFVLILPVWLLITYIKMKNGKKSGFVQCALTSILMVPGLFVLIKLMSKDGFINPIEYLMLILSSIFSLLLLRKLYIVKKQEEIKLGYLDFLFGLFVIANFTILNFFI